MKWRSGGASAAALVVLSAGSAQGFTLAGTSCSPGGDRLSYLYDLYFPVNKRGVADAGMRSWNYFADWGGGADVQVAEALPAATGLFVVRSFSDVNSPIGGYFQCDPSGPDELMLNVGKADEQITAIASHEIGHALKQLHVGYKSELDAQGLAETAPRMSTCLPSLADAPLGNDDQAGLNHKNGAPFSDGIRSVTSEVGFERNPHTAWSSIPANRIGLSSATYLTGNLGMAFFPQSGQEEMTQFVNATLMYNHNADLVTSVKRNDALATIGDVQLELFGRTVTYADAEPYSCAAGQYANPAKDYNVPTQYGALVLRTARACPVSTSWTNCGTPVFDANDAVDAYEFKIRVRSSVRRDDASFLATVYFDNLRVRDRS